jgi:hypothetical protein
MIALGPKAYYANQKFFKSRLVTSNKTSSNLCLRNMGVERNYNSETVSLREENSKKNIRTHKRKSNIEN